MSPFITKRLLLTSGDIKREARAQLTGHWREAVFIHVIPIAIVFLVTLLLVWLADALMSDGRFYLVFNVTRVNPNSSVDLIADLLTVHFMSAISFTFLELIRNSQREIAPLKDVFRNFKQPWIWKILGLYIVRFVFTFLWSLLFIIPGIIKSYSYSQSLYILYDDLMVNGGKNLSIIDCITESRMLMKGHKLDLFVLQISFVFWNILGILTLGVALLWVAPYQNMSLTIFYENLLQRRQLYANYEPVNNQSIDRSAVGQDPDDFSDF